jgi:phosphatidylglycerophosphate synthase
VTSPGGQNQSRRIPPWLPNAISAARIALVPVWLALACDARQAALSGNVPSPLGPLLVLLAIGASDVVDGFVARRFALTTNLGATLDAVADKIAQISTVTFLVLAGAPAFTALPVWLMVSLATRDFLLAVGWYAVHRRRGEVKAEHRWHGKAASALLFVLVVAALVGVSPQFVVSGSAVVVAFVVPSTIVYLRSGWRQLSSRGSAEPP